MKDLKEYIDFTEVLSDTFECQEEYMEECIKDKWNIIHLEDESEENLIKTQKLFENIIGSYNWLWNAFIQADDCTIDFDNKTIWISFWESSSMWESWWKTWYNVWFKIDFSNWEDEAYFSDYVYDWF